MMTPQDSVAEGLDHVTAIQDLHQDLLALSESRLVVIERLQAELEGHLEAFRQLLDHKEKNETSRAKIRQSKEPFHKSNLANVRR